MIEVDQFGGSLDGTEGGFFNTSRCACKGEHRAVVVEIRGTVQHFHFADRLDGGNDLVNDFGSSRFGKVGDAFDERSRHRKWIIRDQVIRKKVIGW